MSWHNFPNFRKCKEFKIQSKLVIFYPLSYNWTKDSQWRTAEARLHLNSHKYSSLIWCGVNWACLSCLADDLCQQTEISWDIKQQKLKLESDRDVNMWHMPRFMCWIWAVCILLTMSHPQQKYSAKLIGQNFENCSSSTNQVSLDGGTHDTAAAALLWTHKWAYVSRLLPV